MPVGSEEQGPAVVVGVGLADFQQEPLAGRVQQAASEVVFHQPAPSWTGRRVVQEDPGVGGEVRVKGHAQQAFLLSPAENPVRKIRHHFGALCIDAQESPSAQELPSETPSGPKRRTDTPAMGLSSSSSKELS